MNGRNDGYSVVFEDEIRTSREGDRLKAAGQILRLLDRIADRGTKPERSTASARTHRSPGPTPRSGRRLWSTRGLDEATGRSPTRTPLGHPELRRGRLGRRVRRARCDSPGTAVPMCFHRRVRSIATQPARSCRRGMTARIKASIRLSAFLGSGLRTLAAVGDRIGQEETSARLSVASRCKLC
jgi:hypothetical protein